MIVVGFAALAGCAGVLGFEDIVFVAAVPDAAALDSASGARIPGAGLARRPEGEIVKRTQLVALTKEDALGELWPRLTRDELTIVFERYVPGPAAFNRAPFIARRSNRDAAFEAPERLLPEVIPVAQTPSLSADGARIYLVQDAEGGKVLHTIASGGALEAIKGPPRTDAVHPFFVETTRELFYARAFTTGSYAIYRATGSEATFSLPVQIVSIMRPSAGATTAYVEPVLSDDGRRLYFSTYRDFDDGGAELGEAFVATRENVGEPTFGEPQIVRGIDVREAKIGWVSPDECRLYTYRIVGGFYRLFVEERAPQ